MTPVIAFTKKIFFFIFLVVCSFVLLEVLVRIYGLFGTNYDIEMWKYSRELKQKNPDPNIVFEHIPNKSLSLERVPVSINSLGFRGHEYSKKKPVGVFRILVLGSSFTFGWGVKQEERFTDLLENKLTTLIKTPPIEVLNSAVCNYVIQQQERFFLTTGKDLDPDFVVLNFTISDIENIRLIRPNYFINNFQSAVLIWSRWAEFLVKFGWAENYLSLYQRLYQEAAPEWRRLTSSIETISDYCKKEKIGFLVAITAEPRELIFNNLLFTHERLAGFLKSKKINFVDSLSLVQKYTAEELLISKNDIHGNAWTHKLFAEQLEGYFLSLNLWTEPAVGGNLVEPKNQNR